MLENVKKYQQVKSEAKRLMRRGDLKKYFLKLKEMYELRMLIGPTAGLA